MGEYKPLIGTVILNYRTYEDTIACVKSLKKQSYPRQTIVIVENGSGNESADILSETYAGDPIVHVIISDENVGFARGNNIGIRYAHDKLGCDFVFVLNSDTIVPDHVFDAVVKAYRKDIGVISPSVADVNGKLTPPSENSEDIYCQIKKREQGLRTAVFLSLPFVRHLYSAYRGLKKLIKKESTGVLVKWTPQKYVLQGCSYFLTPSFFEYYRQLYPDTFLYWEEVNLLVYLHKVGLKSIAIETPPVIHKKDGSTTGLYSDFERNRRKLKLSIDSYRSSKKMYGLSYEEILKAYQ